VKEENDKNLTGDNADRADAVTRAELEAAIAIARANLVQAPYTGRCLYCGAVTDAKRRWCDAECRDAWEVEKSQQTE